MKTLWIINHYAQKPDEAGGMKRHYYLAKYLRRRGWRTSIIANSVEYNTYRQRLNKGEKYRLEKVGDVEFLWLKAPSYTGNGYGRMWNMLQFTTSAFFNLRHSTLLDRPDAVIGSSPHPLAAWAGWRISKYYSAPFLFEVRDLWPETLIQFGRLSHDSPVSSGLRWIEKKLAKHSVHILSVLPKADDYFSRYDIPSSKVSWISNGADLENVQEISPAHSGDRFLLTYFGAHGNANDLQTLMDALSHIKQKDNIKNIHCRLIGDGPLKKSLQAKAASLRLDNIEFRDSVPRDKLSSVIQNTDAFVLNVKNLPSLYRYGVSMNKIYDYMALGKPIIASVQAVNNPIIEEQCGVCTPPESPEELANAIIELSNMEAKKREQMGKNGRDAVLKKYNYEMLAKQLAEILKTKISSNI